MKNQVWGKNFITKVFTDFCSKNVLLLSRNCFYYENGYFPNYCPHFFFHNFDLGTSGTITTKTKINIFWKQNFFKLGIPFLWKPFAWIFSPKIFRFSRQTLHLLFSTFQLIVSGLTFLIPTTRKFWSDLGRVTRR